MRKIPEEFWDVVFARFKKMPSNLKLVIGVGSLSKKEILEHLSKRDEVGKLIVKMQLEYLKLFKE